MTELQFDSKIEERYIIGYLIKGPSMFLRMGGYLKTNDYLKNSKFIDNKLQWLLNIVCKYNERFGKFPSETELTILADKQFKEDETLCGLFKKTVKEICNIDLSEVNFKEEADTFIAVKNIAGNENPTEEEISELVAALAKSELVVR